MVIEDNLADILLLRKVFKYSKIDAEIFAARGGDEGLELLEKTFACEDGLCLDLILLDIRMPGLDGLQVLEIIRSNPGFQSVPIIMFTESRLEGDVVASLALGATSFVNKAANLSELFQVVRNICESWLPRGSMILTRAA